MDADVVQPSVSRSRIPAFEYGLGGHNQEFCFTTVGLVLKIIKLEYVSSGYRRTAIYYILTLASYFSPYLNIC